MYGRIIVQGDSAINAGGITVLTTVTGVLTEGTIYSIVSAPSGTNGATVNVINNSPRYTFSGLPTTLGNVDIILTSIQPLQNLVETPEAIVVAPILEEPAPIGSDLREIQDAIAGLTTKEEIDKSLAQLAPGNTNLAAPWVTIQTARQFDDLWMTQVEQIQRLCCDDNCGPAMADKPLDLNACIDAEQKGVWWTKAFGSQAEQGNLDKRNGYETDAYGLMIAYDTPLNSHTRVGLGGGYARSSIDGNNSWGSTDIDSYQVTGYMHHEPGPLFVQAAVTAGINQYETARQISIAGINRSAESDYSGQQYSGIVTLGTRYLVNETIITPTVSMRASHVRVDGYKEDVAGALNLSIDKQKYNFVQSTVGIKAERIIRAGNHTYAPEVHANWLHDFKSTTMEQDAAFATGSSFNIQGIDQDRDLYNVGAGITFLSCNCEEESWTVKGLYDYKWNNSEYSSHQVSLLVGLKF